MTQENTSSSSGSACCSGGRSWKRLGLWLGLMLLVVAYLQWPMVKGLYYRASASPVPADGIAWRTDLSEALGESARSGKPVLADFSATWCPPCQVMKHEVWPDARVAKAVNEGFIPVALDADAAGSRGPAQQYGVEAIPTLLALDSQGKVLRQAHFLNVAGLRDFLAGK